MGEARLILSRPVGVATLRCSPPALLGTDTLAPNNTGIVRLAWSSYTYEPAHFLRLSALEILGGYLTDTSVAELQKEFVECDDALAGAVYMGVEYWNPAQVRIVNLGISGGDEPTGPFRDARRFPSTRW